MKCENTRPAIQRVAVKYYCFEEVWRGCQLSHAALITVHPRTCTSRTISPGLPFIGCGASAGQHGSTDDSQKREGECFPLAGPAHVPAGVFKNFTPPGRKINIWMIMRRVGGWGGGDRGAGSSMYLPTSLDLSGARRGLICFDPWPYVNCILRPPTDLECGQPSRKSADGQPGLFSQRAAFE